MNGSKWFWGGGGTKRACWVRSLVLALVLPGGVMKAALQMTGPAVPGFEAYDRFIPALLEEGSIAGVTVAVAYRGRIVFARGYGLADRETGRPVQPDTRFRIGSVSKPITAALVLKLVEEGKLSLEDRAFPLLGYPTPTYPGARRDPRLDRVTVRQLLSHTGGWDFYSAPNTLAPDQVRFDPTSWPWHLAQVMQTVPPASAEATVRFMVGQPLQAEPGTIWSYTNFGYLALGRIIEQKTGLSYEDAVEQFVGNSYVSGLAIGGTHRHELAPDEAVYYDNPNALRVYLYNQFGAWGYGPLVPRPYAWSVRGSDACGGWCISAIETLRFLLALEGQEGMPALLKPESVAAMRSGTPLSPFYGLGWFTTNAGNTDPPGTDSGHGGGHHGTTAYALRTADGDWHLVALLNGSVDPSNSENLNRMNRAASAVLHMLPAYSDRPEHDFTWSTLGWDAWGKKFFGAAGAGALEDDDHDGVANLVEYAAGLDPTRGDALEAVSFAMDGNGVPVLTYRRLILGHPLAWKVEASFDGETWQADEGPGEGSVLNPDGTLSVSLRLPGAVRARLRVAQHATGAETVIEAPLTPQNVVLEPGGGATLTAVAPSNAELQWRQNGVAIPGATTRQLTLANVHPADAGIYSVDVGGASPSTSVAAIVAIRSKTKVTGAGEVWASDIRHPNGNIYDQIVLTGPAATVTADPGKVTRVSFIDLTDDIVQVEFSGAGSLTIVLSAASGPALPANYHQRVSYMKGHATLLIADAGAETYVAVFSVGRANAVNQALFDDGIVYDGVADIAACAVQSVDGKCGGFFLGNAHLFATAGVTGLWAAGVAVSGPVRLGDVSAFDQAVPMLMLGAVPEVTITGGDLEQPNRAPVNVTGIARVNFVAGGKSDGTPLPAQSNRATLIRHGVDATAWLVAP